VPRSTLKLKKKEFSELDQGNMMVNEYPNQFIQLSRYATDDVNTDEKKQDTFLKGLKDEIQFQLLNTDNPDFCPESFQSYIFLSRALFSVILVPKSSEFPVLSIHAFIHNNCLLHCIYLYIVCL
jgi:hypothetical protein